MTALLREPYSVSKTTAHIFVLKITYTMFLVGLTGGIATGKSTVSKTFQELGVDVIDADVVARKVVEPGKPAWTKIKDEFGTEVLLQDGSIDRPALARIIFSDPVKRRRLDAITHPQIYKQMVRELIPCFLKGHQFAILDLPLLFESGAMVNYVHKVITVTCREEQQLQRLMERNELTQEDAQKRIKAQMPLEEKCNRANFVIDNSGSLEETRKQVLQVNRVLKHSKFHWKLRLYLMLLIGLAMCIFLWLAFRCIY